MNFELIKQKRFEMRKNYLFYYEHSTSIDLIILHKRETAFEDRINNGYSSQDRTREVWSNFKPNGLKERIANIQIIFKINDEIL